MINPKDLRTGDYITFKHSTWSFWLEGVVVESGSFVYIKTIDGYTYTMYLGTYAADFQIKYIIPTWLNEPIELDNLEMKLK